MILSLVPFSSLPRNLSRLTGHEVVWPTSTFEVAAHLDAGPPGPPGKCRAAMRHSQLHPSAQIFPRNSSSKNADKNRTKMLFAFIAATTPMQPTPSYVQRALLRPETISSFRANATRKYVEKAAFVISTRRSNTHKNDTRIWYNNERSRLHANGKNLLRHTR